jgi:DNA-binding NarL/FixJ family response regulator
MQVGEDDEIAGWLFLKTAAVPEHWRDRAVEVSMIPLLAHELSPSSAVGAFDQGWQPTEAEFQLMQLVAGGRTKNEIARQLRVAPRTLDRRLAALRSQVGARTFTELTATLARQGFGG